MTIRAALRTATSQLGEVSDTPRLDAELLMAHALGTTRDALILRHLDAPTPPAFEDLLTRRLAHEPVAYITGSRDFWTISLHVAPGVLIPRPDSETLIEAAVEHFAGTPGPRSVLDLGTGSGALLLAALAEWPAATGIGIDASDSAIAIARDNVRRLDMTDRARIERGGWSGRGGPHDLILCNPPYIGTEEALPREVADWEPATALFAGADGLDDYRAIAAVLRPQLGAGGVACIEIGASQADSAGALFVDQGFAVSLRRDLAGRARCLVVT
ncbi:protein-(glutamine-N5) methyltransferase, release factor-specific [Sphingomonas sp. Leaf33]|uniref:peptide chain release factor N(5)-glutamine methyltransferase n=1 Tax=Sphingomonas sp. Leaf33 TaxID=1736215 RepID=UPI0006F5A328|nr:peptide chain release factor N(5)-glutamine methyltransferase [Sphingomonas sp. Leaf33]KQN20649.1 protein-(glutamine-N5) methyltransferase, release factor-specific [Sphingomonas sp. Leaf33]